MNVLDDFYAPKVLDGNYCYDESRIYHQLPATSEHQAYLAYIRTLPINDTPEIFGLHENANSEPRKMLVFDRATHVLFQLHSLRTKPTVRCTIYSIFNRRRRLLARIEM